MHDAHVEANARDAIEREGRPGEEPRRRVEHRLALFGADARERPDERPRATSAHFDEGDRRAGRPLAHHDVDLVRTETYVPSENDEAASDEGVARGFFCGTPEGVPAGTAHFAEDEAAGAAVPPAHWVRWAPLSQSPWQSTLGSYFVFAFTQ